MINAEKIIRRLELQLDDLQKYAADGELLTLTQEQAKEIIALLKEQGAKPTPTAGTNEIPLKW